MAASHRKKKKARTTKYKYKQGISEGYEHTFRSSLIKDTKKHIEQESYSSGLRTIELAEKYKQCGEVLYLKAFCLFKLERYEEGIRYAKKRISYGFNVQNIHLLVLLYIKTKDFKQIEQYIEVLRDKGYDTRVHALEAEIFFVLNRHDEAIRSANLALANANDKLMHTIIAETYRKKKMYKKAIAVIDENFKNDARMLICKGYCNMELGIFEVAFNMFICAENLLAESNNNLSKLRLRLNAGYIYLFNKVANSAWASINLKDRALASAQWLQKISIKELSPAELEYLRSGLKVAQSTRLI